MTIDITGKLKTLHYHVRGSGPMLLIAQGGDGDANRSRPAGDGVLLPKLSQTSMQL
ncbi:hypothetical protein [Nonomuraea turcica]|uniref:hypothetical protein n=1 Tax=Nonomuraea sp. G32 TaxID=3067274 RepID=UPI00273BA69A|nr:hypothetical protein [Nonomuraea sp. G32]MDP4500941.1 hypothetical protein [Nonomuraea sp. G32]